MSDKRYQPQTVETAPLTEDEIEDRKPEGPGLFVDKVDNWSLIPADIDPKIYQRLNIGSGATEHGRYATPEGSGWLTLDINPKVNPDVIHDITQYPWPFEDSQFHEVQAAHLLEHLDDWIGFFSEMYRVCAHGAVVRIAGPHWANADTWSDPTHRRGLSEKFFAYLSAKGRNLMDVDHYNTLEDLDFETELLRPHIDPAWEGKSEEARQWAAQHYINVIKELEVFLRVYKPKRSFEVNINENTGQRTVTEIKDDE